jgi:hypothetical protein
MAVRGRRAQYSVNTGPEGIVPQAALGGGGAGLRPAGAATGQEC